jgi:hypothetical protein
MIGVATIPRRRRLLARRRRAEAAATTERPQLVAPEGTIEQVRAWVGDDRQRAEVALAAEWDGKQRRTLIAELERLAG